jgi:hypothetical protein
MKNHFVRLAVEVLEDRTLCDVKLFDNGQFAVWARDLATISESAVPLYYQGNLQGNFKVVEGYYGDGTGGFPQAWADEIANTFIRPTYPKGDGTTGTLATSVAGTFSYRTAGGLQLLPTISRADVTVNNQTVVISLTANFGAAATEVITRTYYQPFGAKTFIDLSVQFTANQDIVLDNALLGQDALRAPTIETMFSSDTAYDTNLAEWLATDLTQRTQRLQSSTPRGAHLFANPMAMANEYGGLKTPGSTFNSDGPSVYVRGVSVNAVYPGQAPTPLNLGAQGFLANTTNTSDDSLTFWPEITNAPGTIANGTVLLFAGQISGFPPGPLAYYTDASNGLMAVLDDGSTVRIGRNIKALSVGADRTGEAEAYCLDQNNHLLRYQKGELSDTGGFGVGLAAGQQKVFFLDGANRIYVYADNVGFTFTGGYAIGFEIGRNAAGQDMLVFLDGANRLYTYNLGVFTWTGAYATRYAAGRNGEIAFFDGNNQLWLYRSGVGFTQTIAYGLQIVAGLDAAQNNVFWFTDGDNGVNAYRNGVFTDAVFPAIRLSAGSRADVTILDPFNRLYVYQLGMGGVTATGAFGIAFDMSASSTLPPEFYFLDGARRLYRWRQGQFRTIAPFAALFESP